VGLTLFPSVQLEDMLYMLVNVFDVKGTGQFPILPGYSPLLPPFNPFMVAPVISQFSQPVTV